MIKHILLSGVLFLLAFAGNAQQAPLPFAVSCECELKKEFEKPGPGGYLVSSYACNADRLGEATLYRVTVMDLSKDLRNQPTNRVQAYTANYYASLKTELEKANLFITEKQSQGRQMLEYTQLAKLAGETLPQRTAVFLSGTKSITLQLTSSSSEADKQFEEFKANFAWLGK